MRIVHLITSAQTGGAQENVLTIASHQAKMGHSVEVWYGIPGPLSTYFAGAVDQVVEVSELSAKLSFKDFLAVRSVARMLRQHRVDLLHCHSSKAGLVGRLGALFTRTPTVFTAHGLNFAPYQPAFHRVFGIVTEYFFSFIPFFRVVTVSDIDLERTRRLFGRRNGRCVRIRYGLDPLAARTSQVPSPKFRLLCAARLAPQKDHETLIRALALLPDLELHLKIAGEGPLRRRLEDLVTELSLSERVEFLGNVTNCEVREELEVSDLFVLSTHYEGIPISIIEALRAGIPVVATHVDGVPEAVLNGVNGRTCPHGDASAFAEAIRETLLKIKVSQSYSEGSLEVFAERFGADRMIMELDHLYRSLVGNGNPALCLSN